MKPSNFSRGVVMSALLIGIFWIILRFHNEYEASIPTPTPTLPPTFEVSVSKTSFCHNGPNDNYGGAVIVLAYTNVKVLGMTLEEDWFMIQGAEIDRCWIKAAALSLPSNIDLEGTLKFVTAVTLKDTPCLIYPSAGSEMQTLIPANWRLVAYGKVNQDADWVLVNPHDSTELCWVDRTALSGFKNIYLPVVPMDVAFTSTPTPTNTSTATLSPTPTPTPTQTPTSTRVFITVPPTSVHHGGNKPTATNPPSTQAPPTSAPPTSVPPSPALPTSIPPTSKPNPTATLCWPPGKCK